MASQPWVCNDGRKVTGSGTIDMVWETRYNSANPTADMARYTTEISVLAPIDRETCIFSIHTYHIAGRALTQSLPPTPSIGTGRKT